MRVTRREFSAIVPGVLASYALSRVDLAGSSEAPPGVDLAALTLAEASAKVRAGAVTSVQLTEACLARLAMYDPKLDAFITVLKQQALAQAHALDAEHKAGTWRGPLHGIPIALKDNIDTAGARTTAGSAVFEDRVPLEDAPVVTRLKAAGAVILWQDESPRVCDGRGRDLILWCVSQPMVARAQHRRVLLGFGRGGGS